MDAVAALSAGAAQGRIHLGHRRLLLPRHHARRRDAHHRDGGDERLPQGTARQDPRPQRPSAGAAAGIAADRLAGGGRAASPRSTASGSRRRSSKARRWRPRRSTPPACWCAASAAPISTSSPRSPSNIKQGTLEGFDEGPGGRDRPAARRPAVAARRRQRHAGRAARRGDADGHHAADQGLQDRRRVRDRHVGIRRRLRVHAAAGGAGLFQPLRRRHRDRGLHQQSGPRSPTSASWSPRPPSARSS